jgi:hypothetical protein
MKNVNMPRVCGFLFWALCAASFSNAQVGCPSSGWCTNPVPAVNVAGTWIEPGVTWNISSNSMTVSGSVVVTHPVWGCSAITYTVSGSITPASQTDSVQGSTAMNWLASSPSPSGACGGYTPVATQTMTGTIQNNGNDFAYGTWSQPAPGGGTIDGSFTMSKSPTDTPSSETTNAVGFSAGLLATVGQFRQTLNATPGSTDIFKGRQVSETTGSGSNYDNCSFPGATVPKWTGVQGSSWNVGYYAVNPPYITSDNVWADDYIGWNTAQVNYYRTRLTPSSFPCEANVPQAMHIATNGTSGNKVNYANGQVGSKIFLNKVVVSRHGVSQEVDY